MFTHFQKDDVVKVSWRGRSVDGSVRIASPNGDSLVLVFDGALGNSEGMYVGSMPVLWLEEKGYFSDLLNAEPVEISKEI
jgi:hypothetical protein